MNKESILLKIKELELEKETRYKKIEKLEIELEKLQRNDKAEFVNDTWEDTIDNKIDNLTNAIKIMEES